MPKKANIREIAKAAGVSVATVSGILNNTGRRSPATAARIRAVMQEMNYVPRRNKLRKPPTDIEGRMNRVGLLFPDTHKRGTRTPLGKALTDGVQSALAEKNIQVSILTLRPDGSLPDDITSGELDGLVIRSGSQLEEGDSELFEQLEAIGLPMVWTFGSETLAQTVDAVRMDDRGCGMLAAKKVNAQCHGPIYILKPTHLNVDIEMRAFAFSLHLMQRGIKATAQPMVIEDALRKIKQQRSKKPITLFIAGHDSEVTAAYEKLLLPASSKGIPVHFVAILTGKKRFKAQPGATIDLLHIDPFRIGMAAGCQLLNRYHSPWADTVKLIVTAKEVGDANAINQHRSPKPPSKLNNGS